MNFFFDLETVPGCTPEQLHGFAYEQVPSNYKDEAKKNKWASDNIDKVVKNLSLGMTTAKVCCASWAHDDLPVVESSCGEDEESIIKDLLENMNGLGSEDCIVTYNGDKFDLKILRLRAMKYGFKFPNKAKSVDLMAALYPYGSWVKQDDLAQFLGLNPSPSDGSQVYSMYQDERWDEMVEYCNMDVRQLAEIFEKALDSGMVMGYKKY